MTKRTFERKLSLDELEEELMELLHKAYPKLGFESAGEVAQDVALYMLRMLETETR